MDLERYLGRKKTPKITENQDQGEQDESLWRADEGIEGGEVTNRHIGHDHETKRKNHLTNTYRNITVENKSSPTAPIRPLQKKFAKASDNYNTAYSLLNKQAVFNNKNSNLPSKNSNLVPSFNNIHHYNTLFVGG